MPASGLFSMNTKPYFDAADKSCSGAFALDGETSMTGIWAFDVSILCHVLCDRSHVLVKF